MSVGVGGGGITEREKERWERERGACQEADKMEESEGAAFPADLRRGVEMAAGARRSERRRYNLAVDARGYSTRSPAGWGRGR